MGCRRRLTAGDYRWLSVGPPGQEDLAVVLNAIPDPPVMDEETAEQIEAVLAKGWLWSVFLQTDDLRASYEELKARGVEFTEGPEERPLRDRRGLPRPLGQLDPAGRGERGVSGGLTGHGLRR